jgi:hypothetical protein
MAGFGAFFKKMLSKLKFFLQKPKCFDIVSLLRLHKTTLNVVLMRTWM